MKIATKYNRIDRVIYTFDEVDIRNALAKYAEIKLYEAGKRIVFGIDMGDEDNKISATLTIIWESPGEES